jgi:hypothetical protein
MLSIVTVGEVRAFYLVLTPFSPMDVVELSV